MTYFLELDKKKKKDSKLNINKKTFFLYTRIKYKLINGIWVSKPMQKTLLYLCKRKIPIPDVRDFQV